MTTNYHDAIATGAAANAATFNAPLQQLDAAIQVVAVSAPIYHDALLGLTSPTTDDDHTQYALLYGRSGGQVMYGGTGANESIEILGTRSGTNTTSKILLKNGNVGIGTDTADAKLHITSYSTTARGLQVSGTYSGIQSYVVEVNTTHPANAGVGIASYYANGTVSGANAVTHIIGFQSSPNYTGTGSLANTYNFYASASLTGTGTKTNRYGVYVADATVSGGALTTQYGVIVATMSAATTNWGIYVNGNNSYFGADVQVIGEVYINATSGTPVAKLTVTSYVGTTDLRGVKIDGTYADATAHPVQLETYHPLAAGNAAAGFDSMLHVTGGAAVDHVVGFQSRPDYAGTVSLAKIYDFFAGPLVTGAGTVASRFGLYVQDTTVSAGALTTQYGVFVAALDAAATNWGLYVAGNNSYMAGSLVMAEMTAPDAPAANTLVLYAVDNGAGKTQLMVRFPSGVAQQIAIEA